MATHKDISKQSLNEIKSHLANLNPSDLWKLIDHVRDECKVIIPVWFTIPLVQEISSVKLTQEEAQDVIECVNNNEMSYALGRDLIESIMENYYPDNAEDKSDTDDEKNSNDVVGQAT